MQPLDFEEAVDRQAQALSDLAADVDARAQAVKDARQAIADLKATPADERPEDFAEQMAAAQADLQAALDDTSLALEGNTDAARRNREDLRGLVDDSVGVIEAAREQGRSLEDLQVIRAMEIQSLRDQLTQMGFNREEIDKYVGAIEDIPLTRATTIDVETAKAEAKLKAWRDRMQREIDLNPFSIDVLQAEKFAAGPRGHAAGGSVFDGDFIVGEAGTPELLRKRGSDVEVIAGSLREISTGGVSADLVALMAEQNALLALIAGNTAGPTTGQRLRRVQTMAGAI
jgi:hypothetical protein